MWSKRLPVQEDFSSGSFAVDEQEVTLCIWPMTRSPEQSRGTGGGRLAVPCGGAISGPARKTLGVVLACRTRLVTRLGIKGRKIPSFSASYIWL